MTESEGSPNLPKALPSQAIPRHQAEAPCDGGQRAEITLGDQVYLLRVTRAGKLILTK